MSQSKHTDDPHPIFPLPKASPGIPVLSPKEARLQTPVKRPHFRFVHTSAASPVEVHNSQHTGDTGRVALTLFSLRVPGVEEAFHSKDFLLSHFPRQTLRKRVGGEGTSGKSSAPS